MQNRFEIDMLLLQTQAAIHASRAMVAASKRDQVYAQQVMEQTRRAIEKSFRQLVPQTITS